MLSLTETIIGFSAIMLMLSLLVKSLTSLIKNHFDYYTDNLKQEVTSLLQRALGAGWAAVQENFNTWAGGVNWERYDEKFLTRDNLLLVLYQIGVTPAQIVQVRDWLDTYVNLSVANVKYAFEQRMKNLSLAAGLALCLFANINAFSIWKALYTDEKLRTSFADSYARQAVETYKEVTKSEDKAGTSPTGTSTAPSGQAAAATSSASVQPVPPRGQSAGYPGATTGSTQTPSSAPQTPEQAAELEKQRLAFREKMGQFLSDVSFGVGAFWREAATSKDPRGLFWYEFFGSFLTGLLVSIGAPYWHDLLQAMSALRQRPSKTLAAQ